MHDSTNASDFLDFVTNLFGELLPLENGVKPLLVIDNHKAHLGNRIERMEQLGFHPMRLPIYSSELNAIETVWSLLKRKAKSQFTKFAIKRQLTKYRCMFIVEEQIKTIARETFINLTRAHYDDI